jgi:methylamine utilization protein MauE
MCEFASLILGGSVVASGGVMIIGGQWKLRDPALFRGTVRAQGIKLGRLARLVVAVLPWVELFVGVSAVVGGAQLHRITLAVAGLGLGLLGTLFTVYVVASLRRGVRSACGCLDAHEGLGKLTAARSAFLAASGWIALAAAPHVDDAQDVSCVAARLAFGMVIGAVLVLGFRPFARSIESVRPDTKPGTDHHSVGDG